MRDVIFCYNFINFRVYEFKNLIIMIHMAFKPRLLFVQLPQKWISHYLHNTWKCSERISQRLLMLKHILILHKAVVYHSKHLVHPLYVIDAWIEFRIQKQNICKRIRVGVNVFVSLLLRHLYLPNVKLLINFAFLVLSQNPPFFQRFSKVP